MQFHEYTLNQSQIKKISFQPSTHLVPPGGFIDAMRENLQTLILPPRKSIIHIDLCPEAISFNAALLKSFDYEILKIIDAFPNSELSYGNGVRPFHVLKHLLHQRHNWKRMGNFLAKDFAP